MHDTKKIYKGQITFSLIDLQELQERTHVKCYYAFSKSKNQHKMYKNLDLLYALY